MVLVQFFEDNNISDLQNMVNGFLKSKTITNVIDIKYNQILLYHSGYDSRNEIQYTAMVIYSGYVEFDNNDSVPKAEVDKDQGYAVRRPL
jgi:hypothetical protein